MPEITDRRLIGSSCCLELFPKKRQCLVRLSGSAAWRLSGLGRYLIARPPEPDATGHNPTPPRRLPDAFLYLAMKRPDAFQLPPTPPDAARRCPDAVPTPWSGSAALTLSASACLRLSGTAALLFSGSAALRLSGAAALAALPLRHSAALCSLCSAQMCWSCEAMCVWREKGLLGPCAELTKNLANLQLTCKSLAT